MSAVIMSGKDTAAKYKKKIAEEVAALPGRKPGLAVVIVGEDPASQIYVRNKKADCDEVGIYAEIIPMPETTSQRELLEVVQGLNKRDDIDGILVQHPLPNGLDEKIIFDSIDPDKDVDAFNAFNVGLIVQDGYTFPPGTPAGVMALLDEYKIDPEGKLCVIVGRSNIVGKPQAMLMLHRNATVTICHSKTPDLGAFTRTADILISAAGKRGLITADMIKDGAVVIDVAMNRKEDGKLCGDVVFDEAAQKASYITPVPGGVGPMTRVMLLRNTMVSYNNRMKG